jgi:hypothetical protein
MIEKYSGWTESLEGSKQIPDGIQASTPDTQTTIDELRHYPVQHIEHSIVMCRKRQ